MPNAKTDNAASEHSHASAGVNSDVQAPSVSSNKGGTQDSTPERKSRRDDESGMFSEPDLPSDGRDEEGEAMIRELPQSPELSDVPKPSKASAEKS